MDEEFLLSTPTAQKLYHDFAETMPILDYHCHINPEEIAKDVCFENITQVWLGGDHYKWRQMRSNGVDEYYITGDAPAREKFQKWAETLEKAVGNPLFHWSHLELKRYFGYHGVLNGETAEEVWNLCNQKLQEPSMSVRNLIRRGELEETIKYLRTAREKKTDGIVLVGSVFNTLCKNAEISGLLQNIPVVLANGKLELPNSYSVLVDDRYGVSLAVEHLIQKGHREIYYLRDMDTVSAQLKCEGFIAEMEKCGLKNARQQVLETASSIEGGIKAVEQLIRRKQKFTGIVCGEDITAAGVVKALLHYGIKVPEEVAVTGYNNSEYAKICEPQLTTIDNKPELVAMMSVQLLTSLIEKTEVYSSCTIQPELVEGQTT